MSKLTDNSLMPFGAHKGKAMANVPAHTLIWYYNNIRTWSTAQLPVKIYIEENWDLLHKENITK